MLPMKRVVVSTGLVAAEIRPPALMTEFKRLSIADAAEYFGDPEKLVDVVCPACDASGRDAVFRKQEFLYNQCHQCGSLYVSPRPAADALGRYYRESRASRFRVEHFSRDTAKARRYHLLSSHASWMGQLFDEAGNPEAKAYGDYETHSPEIFDEIRAQGLFSPLHAIEPLLAPEGDTPVAVGPVSGLGALSAFEKLEHQFSPYAFVQTLRESIAPGGLLFLTTRTISGFDLQVLWDKTPYIFVPEHLNLLSIEGLSTLLSRSGLEVVEMSTPGQLDVQFVLHALEQDPSIKAPAFIDYLLRKRDRLAHEDFQEYLQKHRLSSHVRVAAKRTD